jgi:hypothetical protein
VPAGEENQKTRQKHPNKISFCALIAPKHTRTLAKPPAKHTPNSPHPYGRGAIAVASPYIPPKDNNLDAWANNFSTRITATPAAFGLLAADAVVIAGLFTTWHAALLLVQNPGTKTATTVAAKNAAKLSMLGTIRTYAQQITANPGVTNANKLLLGLNLPNSAPTPIPAPSSFPQLMLVAMTPGQVTMTYKDSATGGSSKAKPFGATQMQLFLGVDTVPFSDPTLCSLVSTPTKSPIGVTFSPAQAGKIATFFARWMTRTGLVGPWSTRIFITIPTT